MCKTTKLNTTLFIKRAQEVHGDIYDYSLVDYVNNSTKVKIICPIHGVFEQSPLHHYNGEKCSRCQKNKKLTTDEFIKRSKLIHEDKYDYSLVKYVNYGTKVKIICSFHGVFEQSPLHHFNGCGCPLCSKNIKYTNITFIEKANIIHGNKYDYSLVGYKKAHSSIKIICPDHGIFEQIPWNHLNGMGCSLCSKNRQSNNTEFENKCVEIHNNKYDYSLVDYKNNHTPVKIICKKHGIFEQDPYNHLNLRCGCPFCSESKGEKMIEWYFIKNNISYEKQKSFIGCKYKYKLKFDFYLSEINTCIEYDGEQHFSKWDKFEKDNTDFEIRKIRDQIKNDFCKKNNIKLFRIRYDDNVFEKLDILKNEIVKI